MRRYALRGILAHKRRLLSTATAVLLGVAFMAGSLVFTDTMKASLSGAFQDGERSTDVLVRGPVTITTGQGIQHAPVPGPTASPSTTSVGERPPPAKRGRRTRGSTRSSWSPGGDRGAPTRSSLTGRPPRKQTSRSATAPRCSPARPRST
jgi:putative ABC transport system permease protein